MKFIAENMRALGIARRRGHQGALPCCLTLEDVTGAGIKVRHARVEIGVAKGGGVSGHLVASQGKNSTSCTPDHQVHTILARLRVRTPNLLRRIFPTVRGTPSAAARDWSRR